MLCHGSNRALGLALKNPLPVACNTACMRQLPLAAKQTIRIVGLHQRNAMGLAIVPRSSPLESSEAGMDFDKVAELEKQKREVEKAIMQAVNEKQPVAVVQALETVLKSTTADLERLQPSPGASGQAAGDAGKVYSNITLYILGQGQQGYDKLEKKKATRNQLQRIWKECSYALVARVKSKPAQLLTPATCPDAADMGSVELEDGAHLALVVHQPLNFMGQLVDKINKNTEKGEELQGFKDNNVSEQENTAAAWALKQIKTEPGAQIFCFKKLSQKIGKAVVNEVELDGVACSDTSCNIVERKQQFRHKEVLELIAEINTLKILIDNKAPNTDLLQGKELRFFMMAGSWPTDDTDEQAAVRELMMQHRIQPVMPDGSGYHISWGCNLQAPDQAKRIQNFRDKMERVKQPKPAALQR